MSISLGGSVEGNATSHTWRRSIALDIKVPPDQINQLLDYLTTAIEKNQYLSYLTRSTAEGVAILQYRLVAVDGSLLDVAVKFLPEKIEIYYAPYPPDSVSEKDYIGLDMEMETLIRSYFADQSKASLFLVFSPKMNLIPGKKEGGIKRLISSIIFGNFLYLFMLILLVGIFLYQYFQMLTPILLVGLQFIIVIFANKLIAYRGEFDITADNATIHIAELRMKRNEFEQVVKSCIPKMTLIKKEIYDLTLALGRELDPEIIVRTLNKHGPVCTPELVRIKTVDIYKIVSDLASKFRFHIPRITLLNVLPPNAAATGISPSRATVLITSGLIAQMEEDEIKAVLAHEFSHVRARDPLILMSLATFEYLTRVYLIWPFLASFGLFIDLAYLFLSFTLLFFVAKFLEARADLDAAIITGQPKTLASSLRKLGLWKYQSRIFELVNSGEWLKWDPHPPLYYRIRTLENLDPSKIGNTFVAAIRGCVRGFLDSLHGR
ncbi:MAG: M48 family metalloprotease [Candidatus Methanosuratincola sp.]